MMDTSLEKSLSLSVENRTEMGKRKASLFRKNGKIPAILYGHGIDSRSITVSFLDFSRVYRSAGENTLVELSFSAEKSVRALISDVALDPLSGKFLHIDFYQVRMDEKIEANIPLVFVGESPAVKALGGVLIKALDEIGVSCLPASLPRELFVNVSTLETFDDQIRVSDIAVPEGVAVTDDADTVVVLVERPRSDEEIAALDSKVEADVTKVEGVVKEAPLAKDTKEKPRT